MRALTFLTAAGVLALTGLALASGPGARARPSATMPEVRAEEGRARARAAALDRQARAATEASERATIAAAALAARVQQAEAALAVADAEMVRLRERRRALDLRLARERAPAARLLAGLQTQLRRPVALTLLQPGSLDDAVHLRAVLAAVGPQIAEKTETLRGSLAHARRLEARASAITMEQRALRASLDKRRQELASVSAAERLKARRAAGAADREAERAFAIAAQTRNLSGLVRGLDRPSSSRQGSVRPRATGPLSGPQPYRLPLAASPSSRAGPDRSSLSLPARPGALVVAPGSGRIAFAGPFRGYGAIAIIDHGEGWTSLVTGLAQVRVDVGQAVIAGSPLGEAAGGATEIGLELRRNGERMNPLERMR